MELPSHSPGYLTGPGRQVKALVTGRRETLCPFLARVDRRTLGTTDLPACPLCWGGSWSSSSQKLC